MVGKGTHFGVALSQPLRRSGLAKEKINGLISALFRFVSCDNFTRERERHTYDSILWYHMEWFMEWFSDMIWKYTVPHIISHATYTYMLIHNAMLCYMISYDPAQVILWICGIMQRHTYISAFISFIRCYAVVHTKISYIRDRLWTYESLRIVDVLLNLAKCSMTGFFIVCNGFPWTNELTTMRI